ncbi:hypothetical protein IAD21_02153 [Abditibacteriota bacterium]|nr:hypothetical protein IAD21_02153 [Abditibacteriota bacterium]
MVLAVPGSFPDGPDKQNNNFSGETCFNRSFFALEAFRLRGDFGAVKIAFYLHKSCVLG